MTISKTDGRGLEDTAGTGGADAPETMRNSLAGDGTAAPISFEVVDDPGA
jgi:hypothetical protein